MQLRYGWQIVLESIVTSWGNLNADEQTALKRMNRGPYPALSPDLAARLISLGLTEERSTGIGINRAGRELVINHLIGALRDRCRPALPEPDRHPRKVRLKFASRVL